MTIARADTSARREKSSGPWRPAEQNRRTAAGL